VLLALLPLALAQDSAEVDDVDGGGEIVVMGTRSESGLAESPVAVEVLDREELVASGADTLADALEARPGLQVVRSFRGAALRVHGLDPDFNLHLHDGRVAEAWAVTKPTGDGDINSVELLDGNGQVFVRFFGVRKPGVPEDAAWRALHTGLGWGEAAEAR
jgi:outer membrane receptor for ferrienterochelin and colicin